MSGEPKRPAGEPERGAAEATCEQAAKARRGATMSGEPKRPAGEPERGAEGRR